jgi:hypothetical protein
MTSLDRPDALRLPPARDWRNTFWVFLGVAMFAAMLVAAAYYAAPALISDWRIRDAARPIAGARVSEGKCSAKVVFHICDATLVLQAPSGAVTRRVNYVFTGVHVGDYSVRVLADPSQPELATTDMALDKLWNRTITLAAAMALLLALTTMPIIAAVRNWRASRAA